MPCQSRAARAVCWLGVVTAVAACGGTSEMQPLLDLGTSPSICLTETRGDTYVAGMEKSSQQGALIVKIVSSQPGPPTIGTNTWDIQVRDSGGAGALRSDLTITALPWMPDHNHGTSVKASVTPVGGGSGGEYSVAPLYLFMAGLWQTTLHLQAPGQAMDEVVFSFCIDSN